MKMLLVKYIETNTIEGYVKNKEGFDKWLKEHNVERKENKEIVENEGEFELIRIEELKHEENQEEK